MTMKIKIYEVRTIMFGALVAQAILAIVSMIIGFTTVGSCKKDQYGDWAAVTGALLCAFTAFAGAAVITRQRRIALISLAFGIATSIAILIIEGIAYFCVDMRDGVNRNLAICLDYIENMNSCVWNADWTTSNVWKGGRAKRMILLCMTTLYLPIGVGLMSAALTEGGRAELCQVEEALRELKEANANLSYRKRARRNRILTQYVSQAKPEERQTLTAKFVQFFGFGGDVEPIPIEQRKVKFFGMPADKSGPPSRPL